MGKGDGEGLYLPRGLVGMLICTCQNSADVCWACVHCVVCKFYLKNFFKSASKYSTLVNDMYDEVFRGKCTDVFDLL